MSGVHAYAFLSSQRQHPPMIVPSLLMAMNGTHILNSLIELIFAEILCNVMFYFNLIYQWGENCRRSGAYHAVP